MVRDCYPVSMYAHFIAANKLRLYDVGVKLRKWMLNSEKDMC